MPNIKMVHIRGSLKKPLRHAIAVEPAPKDERLEVTVRLRPRKPLPNATDMLKPSTTPLPILSHDQFEKATARRQKDLAEIRKFAKANNLAVVREAESRRSVITFRDRRGFQPGLQGQPQDLQISQRNLPWSHRMDQRARTSGRDRRGVFGMDNRPVAKRPAGTATVGCRRERPRIQPGPGCQDLQVSEGYGRDRANHQDPRTGRWLSSRRPRSVFHQNSACRFRT